MPAPSGRKQIEQALDMLYRRKWTVILIFLLVAGSTAAYTFSLEPTYETPSFVMLDLTGGRRTTTSSTTTSTGVPTDEELFARNDRTLTGELQVLQLSGQLQQRVFDRMQKMQSDEGGATNLDSTGQAAIPVFNGYVKFEADARSGLNIIKMIGVSSVPRDAAILANLYAEEYVQLTKEASRTHISASRKLLEEQEQKRFGELQSREEAMQIYLSREGAIGLDQGNTYLIQQMAQLDAQRDDTRIDLQMRQASLNALESEINEINPQLARRIASNVDQRIIQLQEQVAEKDISKNQILLQNPNLAPNDSRLEAINRQLQQLHDEIQRLSTQYVEEVSAAGGLTGSVDGLSYVANLRQQVIQERITISGLQAKLQVIEGRLRSYQGDLQSIPQQSLEMARLERARLHAEQLYQFVVQRLQEVQVNEESEPGYAQVLRTAVVPLLPVGPDTQRNLILGLFFGLMLGLGVAVARDLLDNRIYKPDQLQSHGYGVIGTIPDMRPLIRTEFKGQEYLEQDGQRLSTGLVTLLSPISPIAEAYRHVRTSIQFSLPDTLVETLLITSASVEEGKSTTAANLAVIMAESGRRTLLIDADLRRPRDHELFGVDLAPGLVQFLLEEPTFDAALVKTSIENLYVMPAGRVVSRSSELFATKRMRDFLEELRAEFDFIIIDTPPVRVATDAALLATQCDATILVTRAGKTKEGELEFGMEALTGVGARVIGTLLNGFNVSMAYGYKYRYQHYDRYAQYSKYGYYGDTDSKKGRKKKLA